MATKTQKKKRMKWRLEESERIQRQLRQEAQARRRNNRQGK